MDRSGHDKAELCFEHWAGTLDQLVQAARHATTAINELMPFPEGYNPVEAEDRDPEKDAAWKDAQRVRKLSIVVNEKDDFTGCPRDLDGARINERKVDPQRHGHHDHRWGWA